MKKTGTAAKQYGVVLIGGQNSPTGTAWVVCEFGGVLWQSEARYRKYAGPNTEYALQMAQRMNLFKDSHLNDREKIESRRYAGYQLD